MSSVLDQRRRALLAGAGALLLVPQRAWCQIYAGTDGASDAVVLSNFPTDAASVVVVEDPAPPPTGVADGTTARPESTTAAPSAELSRLIENVARQTQVSSALIHAVIYTESRYNPVAVSQRGAIGLMQLLPETGRRFGASDLFSVAQNVSAGASYLKWLTALFDGDLELVLAAYNAGEQAVIKAGRRIPPFPETRSYVKNILQRLGLLTSGDRRAVR